MDTTKRVNQFSLSKRSGWCRNIDPSKGQPEPSTTTDPKSSKQKTKLEELPGAAPGCTLHLSLIQGSQPVVIKRSDFFVARMPYAAAAD